MVGGQGNIPDSLEDVLANRYEKKRRGLAGRCEEVQPLGAGVLDFYSSGFGVGAAAGDGMARRGAYLPMQNWLKMRSKTSSV